MLIPRMRRGETSRRRTVHSVTGERERHMKRRIITLFEHHISSGSKEGETKCRWRSQYSYLRCELPGCWLLL